MRRDARIPQRRATSWVDQSALVGLGLGLALHLVGPAPALSLGIPGASGPLFAFIGAALFTGSVLHPHNVSVGTGADGVRLWVALSLVGSSVSRRSSPWTTHIRSRSWRFSLPWGPGFQPPSTRDSLRLPSAAVNASLRWGWLPLPVGYGVALLIR